MSGIIKLLEDSRDEFIAAAHSVPAAHSQNKPGEGRWSVADCVEHMAIAERLTLRRLQNPEPEPAPPVNKDKEAMFTQKLHERTTRVDAPEAAQPKGRYATLDEAVADFQAARERTVAFAKEQGAEVYKISAKHPFFGPLNGSELLHLMAAHSRRHAAQIREIKEQLAGA